MAEEFELRFDQSNLRFAMCAEAICLAGDEEAVDRVVAHMGEIAAQAKLTPLSWREVLPRVFDAVVREDDEKVSQLKIWVGDRQRSSRMWIPIESLFAAAGQPLPPSGIETEWTDSPEVVHQRWHQLALQRRQRLAS